MVSLGLFNLMGLYDRNVSPSSVVKTTVDSVKMAEDFGFDIAWFAEHHFSNHSICPSSLMMIAHCASETSTINLGTAVLALPLYEPVRVVQEILFAELLTRGRLVVGLGSGYQPHEFQSFRVDISERHARMMEVWSIIEQGLDTGVIDFRGKYFNIPRTELAVSPLGLPKPRMFVASGNPEIVARTARSGHTPFMSYGHRGLDEALKLRNSVAQHWSNATGSDQDMPLGLMRFIYVTEDERDAQHAARCVRDLARASVPLTTGFKSTDGGPFIRLMPLNDEPPLEDFQQNAVIGPASYCVERLNREIKALKPTHLACLMGFAGIGRRETLASLERFGYAVVPHLHELQNVQQVSATG